MFQKIISGFYHIICKLLPFLVRNSCDILIRIVVNGFFSTFWALCNSSVFWDQVVVFSFSATNKAAAAAEREKTAQNTKALW